MNNKTILDMYVPKQQQHQQTRKQHQQQVPRHHITKHQQQQQQPEIRNASINNYHETKSRASQNLENICHQTNVAAASVGSSIGAGSHSGSGSGLSSLFASACASTFRHGPSSGTLYRGATYGKAKQEMICWKCGEKRHKRRDCQNLITHMYTRQTSHGIESS